MGDYQSRVKKTDHKDKKVDSKTTIVGSAYAYEDTNYALPDDVEWIDDKTFRSSSIVIDTAAIGISAGNVLQSKYVPEVQIQKSAFTGELIYTVRDDGTLMISNLQGTPIGFMLAPVMDSPQYAEASKMSDDTAERLMPNFDHYPLDVRMKIMETDYYKRYMEEQKEKEAAEKETVVEAQEEISDTQYESEDVVEDTAAEKEAAEKDNEKDKEASTDTKVEEAEYDPAADIEVDVDVPRPPGMPSSDYDKVVQYTEEMARQEELERRMQQQIAMENANESGFDAGGQFRLPFYGGVEVKLSSDFGPRARPNARASSNHKGVDLIAYENGSRDHVEVLSMTSGTVTFVGYDENGYGNYMDVEYVMPDGTVIRTRYAHLKSISVHKGDVITAGTEIGVEGSTGNVTGIHLHFEVYVDGQEVDPISFISGEVVNEGERFTEVPHEVDEGNSQVNYANDFDTKQGVEKTNVDVVNESVVIYEGDLGDKLKEETNASVVVGAESIVKDDTQVSDLVNAQLSEVENADESNFSGGTYEGIELSYDAAYDVPNARRLTASAGRVSFNGHEETYYPEEVLPGGGLHIPGRHVASDGTIRDEDGYICVACNEAYLAKGEIIMTTLGPAKVYDTGCDYGVVDIYVNRGVFKNQ